MTGLIIHSLKSKKNWFLLNLAICIVIGIVLPLLFKTGYEFFSVLTLITACFIILISTFSDLVFLHDDRKLTYYLSKPISLTKKLNVVLISNVIFSLAAFLLTFFISSLAASILSDVTHMDFICNHLYYIQVIYAWLLIFIFIAALSCELTGNTAVSIFVSIFIFCLPLIVYFVVSYIFYIIDTVIVGINSEILMLLFINKLLPLDKIYFINYGAEGVVNIYYFIRLIITCLAIYTATLIFTGKRKNEKTGNSIVHSSFKYFMSLFASLIAPILITIVMGSVGLITIVITLIVLSALSYYILISAFNKSFKLSKSALKVYIPFILIIALSIFSSSAILSQKAAYIPDADDVRAVYIGDSLSYLKSAKFLTRTAYEYDTLIDKSYEDIKDNDSVILIEEKENIKRVIDLQQAFRKSSKGYDEISIIYYLTNGKKIIRTYNIQDYYHEEITQQEKDIREQLMSIASTDEFIRDKFRVFVDDEYIDNVRINNVNIYESGGAYADIKDFDYKTFSECFIGDYVQFISDKDNIPFLSTDIFSLRSYNVRIDESIKDGQHNKGKIYEVSFDYYAYDGVSPEYIIITSSFKNTRAYLESIITDN